MRVEDFVYQLPGHAVAQEPVEPRHHARLLDTRDMSDHRFLDLPDLLRPGDLVVVNETRVRPARLIGTRADSGGRIELLVLESGGSATAWTCLARPTRRLRPGVPLRFGDLAAEVVDGPDRGLVTVVFDTSHPEAAFAAVGEVPLPPYFEGVLADPTRYQTIFANSPGSAAAPTAGLHFTDQVVDGLRDRGIGLARVDLHVGVDTFRPITTARVEDHPIHGEWCRVPEETARAVAETRAGGGRVVAVGTTVARTLETMAKDDGLVRAGATETRLFLKPGARFEVVEALVTNFHLPGSSLVVLVAAFMGERWREAYDTALGRGYRFLSFGDAMYAERPAR